MFLAILTLEWVVMLSVQRLDFLSFYLLKMPLNVLPIHSSWASD